MSLWFVVCCHCARYCAWFITIMSIIFVQTKRQVILPMARWYCNDSNKVSQGFAIMPLCTDFFRRRRSDRWCRCQVSNESPQIGIHNFPGKPASARPSLSWCLTSWMKMVQGNWHWMKSTLRHQLLGPSRSRKCKVKSFADMYDFLMCFLLLDLFDSKHNIDASQGCDAIPLWDCGHGGHPNSFCFLDCIT